MLWVNLRSRTGRTTRPFSMRNVPSLVMPVMMVASGWTGRTYQKRVTRRPWPQAAIIDSGSASPGARQR
jgi:hypothetical protein